MTEPHIVEFSMNETPESAFEKAKAANSDAPLRGEPAWSLDEVIADMREFVEEHVVQLDPDDDIHAMAQIEGDQHSIISVHPFSGADQQRQVYGVNLPAMVRASRAHCLVAVQPTWVTTADRLPPGMQVSQDPGRTEAIIVLGCDGVRYVEFVGALTRRPDGHPLLGEWRQALDVAAVEAQWIMRGPAAALVEVRLARAMRLWLASRPAEWWTPEREDALAVIELAVSKERGDEERFAAMPAFKSLYGITEAGLPNELVEFANRDDFWELPDPDSPTTHREV